MDYIISHWQEALIGFMVIEKIVKVTPCKWDDILVDGIKAAVTAVKAKKTTEQYFK